MVRSWADRRSNVDALAMYRFLAGAQLLGGVTLIVSYGVGGATLPVRGAGAALVALGAAQVLVGVAWCHRPERLRSLLIRVPGSLAAASVAFATAVSILGGSSRDSLFATSVWCATALGGVPLARWRWGVGAGIITVGAAVGWYAFDDGHGGYAADGDLRSAIVVMAVVAGGGLYLSRIAARAVDAFDRAGAVLRHEHGVLAGVRARLERVEQRAQALGACVDPSSPDPELRALRSQLLAFGATEPGGTLGAVLRDIERDHRDGSVPVRLELPEEADALALQPAAADAVIVAVRRQIANVHRHAPAATHVLIRVEQCSPALEICVEDDGGGTAPRIEGAGSGWTRRQLGRLGGQSGYYAAPSGVGHRITIPARVDATASNEPGLSMRSELDLFLARMLVLLRLASYTADSVIAAGARDEIGSLWLVMPFGAVVIELLLRRGLPIVRLDEAGRTVAGGAVCIVLVAVFSWPSSMPVVLVPSSTSAVVLAQLIYRGGLRPWLAMEALRLVVVMPMVVRHGAAALDLAIVYPIGFSALVFSFAATARRAERVDRAAADAIARASLATSAVRGLALRHDAVDLLARAPDVTPDVMMAGAALEDAIDDVAASARHDADPREAVLVGVRSSMLPIDLGPGWDRGSVALGATGVEAVVDRATLIELGTLIARERSSCAPPGWSGRRRIQRIRLDWQIDRAAGRSVLTATAEPTLRPPEPSRTADLVLVAATLGIDVRASAERLELEHRR